MAFFEVIGEFVASVILRGMVYRMPVRIYQWITGNADIVRYRTEYKKFVKFSAAKKYVIVWQTDTEYLRNLLTELPGRSNDKIRVADFHFTGVRHMTIMQPPSSISFYLFHYLIQRLSDHKIKTVGLVETTHTAYTTYSDPDSENLIGETDAGKRFYISLLDDYSKRQFLRVNRDIITNPEFEMLKIKRQIQ